MLLNLWQDIHCVCMSCIFCCNWQLVAVDVQILAWDCALEWDQPCAATTSSMVPVLTSALATLYQTPTLTVVSLKYLPPTLVKTCYWTEQYYLSWALPSLHAGMVVVGFREMVYLVEEEQNLLIFPVIVKEGLLLERVVLRVTTENRTATGT